RTRLDDVQSLQRGSETAGRQVYGQEADARRPGVRCRLLPLAAPRPFPRVPPPGCMPSCPRGGTRIHRHPDGFPSVACPASWELCLRCALRTRQEDGMRTGVAQGVPSASPGEERLSRTVHLPASRGRGSEGGRTNRAVGKEYTAHMCTSQSFFALGLREHGRRTSASGADVAPGSVEVGETASLYYRCLSTMSTARCSSMVYSPSKQRMGHGRVLSH